MNRDTFERLMAIDREVKKMREALERLSNSWVTGIELAGSYAPIDEKRICNWVNDALKRHLADEIDVMTRSMHELGLEDGEVRRIDSSAD